MSTRTWALSATISLIAGGVTPVFGEGQAKAPTVTFQIVNVPISAVAKEVATATGRKIEVDPKVVGVVTMASERSLTHAELYAEFLRTVKALGYEIQEKDGATRIVAK